MKGGKQGLVSLGPEKQELDQDIREAAANLVHDVIFRAKEMAQRSYQVQHAFSIVEEEDDEAVLAEEMANSLSRYKMSSFSDPTPEIQIDLVCDRTPSPEETLTYVGPPSRLRQVKIRHREVASSPEDSDKFNQSREVADVGKGVDRNKINMRNNMESNNPSDIDDIGQRDGKNQVSQENAQRKDNHAASSIITCSICYCPSTIVQQQCKHQLSTKDIMPATTVQDLVLHGVTEEVLQREGAEEYMCSKPASLPFADDSPPCLGPGLESPSEAQVAERVAKRKSSLFTEMKGTNLKHNSVDLRHFVEEYIKGITEQAQLLANERARKSIPHAKYHSPTDGPRASVISAMKTSEGPWYSRLRSAFTRCFQSTCCCVNLNRQPEAV
ncbi:uncharacterized protein LOC111251078 isoform X1 [Varroa destructor]|uniref:Uncharacterized protein n=2 Tax=Varroa destructor TaxID=109461 RepID=A0A7M7KB31_VARDE|nr:uncharacterized protein LOC111251078 isoform X1 [Varroa destructor]